MWRDLSHFCTVNKNKRRRYRKKRLVLLTTGTETFHEIIYGKSERGANERRVFFVPASTETSEVLKTSEVSVIHRINSSITFPVVEFGSIMRNIAARVGAMSVILTGLWLIPGFTRQPYQSSGTWVS